MTSLTAPRTANDRLKARFGEAMAGGLMLAVLAHFTVFAFFPELTAPDWSRPTVDLVPIIPIDEIPIPAPPVAMDRPAMPVGAVDVPAEATLPVVGFADAVDLPPPAPEDPNASRASSSGFAVYTLGPRLLEPEAFQRALLRAYPGELRDAGIGGSVQLLVSIDEDGRVTGATIGVGSGYDRLDEAALGLVDRMRFSPAMNRDKRVAVTVSIPIEFRVRRQPVAS